MDKPVHCTVLLANHNYERYLRGAINSVLGQTYPHLQLCIIDDASTDNSWSIVEELFAKLDTQRGKLENLDILMAIHEGRKFTGIKIPENVGPSMARNIGINVTLSDSDCYAILDADDEFYPDKIEKCIKKLYSHEAIGQVYADYHILNMATGNLIYEYKWPYSRRKLMSECIIHSGFVAKKEALEKIAENGNVYYPQLLTAEDYDVHLRITEHYIAAHIAEPLTLVRVHNQSSVNYRSNDTWQRSWQLVNQRAQARSKR